MRIALFTIWLLAATAPLCAQLSTEEAMERLRERQKARQAEQKAAATQPSQSADPAPTTRPGAIELGLMSHNAWTLLESRKYPQAAAEFDKLLKLDPKDANALEGRGICRYELNQYKSADRDAETAFNLSTKAGRSSRQTTVAFACTSIMDENPMRAVKLIRGMLDAGTKSDDELQNVFGTALFRANAQAQKLPYYRESLDEYLKFDHALKDQRQDGKGRWGDQWIDASEAQHNWQTYEGAVASDEKAQSDFEHATQHRVDTEDGMVKLHSLRLFGDAERAHIIATYNQAVKEEEVSKKRRDAADKHLASTSKPPFPAKLEPSWKEPR
jgi:tetratricopeptide (TPR) repeat protein